MLEGYYVAGRVAGGKPLRIHGGSEGGRFLYYKRIFLVSEKTARHSCMLEDEAHMTNEPAAGRVGKTRIWYYLYMWLGAYPLNNYPISNRNYQTRSLQPRDMFSIRHPISGLNAFSNTFSCDYSLLSEDKPSISSYAISICHSHARSLSFPAYPT